MKPYHLPKKRKLIYCFLICLTAFTVNSCKKDLDKISANPVNTPAVNDARAWYESTYPVNKAGSLKTSSTGESDMSQFMKPDWNRPASYKRFNKDVIELPLDPSVKVAFNLKNIAANKFAYKKEYSRSSFLLLKDGEGYKAYIMTIIADSAYVKNDLSKLARNTYSKRDTDFSGLVLYFTPKGEYVNGWAYRNGRIVQPGQATAPTGVKTQGTTKATPNTVAVPLECFDWFLLTFKDEVLVSTRYLYTTCTEAEPSESGGGGSPSTPPPCPPGSPGVQDNAVKSGIAVNTVQNPPNPGDDGGGFPPPDNPTPCTVAAPEANINPVKPCALKFKNITSNYMAVAISGYHFGISDNVFGTKIIDFNLQIGMPNYVSIQQAQNAAAAAMLFAEATIANTHGVDFFLSAGAQITYSREFAAIVQEQLTAVLQIPVNVQNAISPGVPIITYADNNCN